jgi:hypothetical protein
MLLTRNADALMFVQGSGTCMPDSQAVNTGGQDNAGWLTGGDPITSILGSDLPVPEASQPVATDGEKVSLSCLSFCGARVIVNDICCDDVAEPPHGCHGWDTNATLSLDLSYVARMLTGTCFHTFLTSHGDNAGNICSRS